MNTILKLSLLAAVVSTVAAGSASADDQRLQDRQVRQNTEPSRTTTVAVYSNDRGVARHAVRQELPIQQEETRFELRSTAHGQVYGVYTAGH